MNAQLDFFEDNNPRASRAKSDGSEWITLRDYQQTAVDEIRTALKQYRREIGRASCRERV